MYPVYIEQSYDDVEVVGINSRLQLYLPRHRMTACIWNIPRAGACAV